MLPFCLRRTKEAVLTELPPKLLEDRVCELHPVQRLLYAAVATSQAGSRVADALAHNGTSTHEGASATAVGAASSGAVASGPAHVFATLQYLRRVCNHPLLALTPSHPLYEQASAARRPVYDPPMIL